MNDPTRGGTTRAVGPGDAGYRAAEALVERRLGDRWQARRGELVDVLAAPLVLVAERDDAVVGVACCADGDGDPPEVELVALAADPEGQGMGGLLIDAVIGHARAAGASAVWLVTTDGNRRALRFYESRGFRVRAVHPDAVTRARRQLKAGIPLTGEDGTPLRHEIELVRPL